MAQLQPIIHSPPFKATTQCLLLPTPLLNPPHTHEILSHGALPFSVTAVVTSPVHPPINSIAHLSESLTSVYSPALILNFFSVSPVHLRDAGKESASVESGRGPIMNPLSAMEREGEFVSFFTAALHSRSKSFLTDPSPFDTVSHLHLLRS